MDTKKNTKKNIKINRRQLGFTLLEMVVVMAMVAIVSGAMIKLVRFSDIAKNLTLAMVEIQGFFRTAQTLALAPPVTEEGSQVRVCGFVVVSDGSDTLRLQAVKPNDGKVRTCRLVDSVNNICAGVTNCVNYQEKSFPGMEIGSAKVFFRVPYGEHLGATEVSVTQTSTGKSRTVKINSFGKINGE